MSVGRLFRRATAFRRALPTILGIGAMRSGTTALFSALAEHPDVGVPRRKEIHFFDIHFHRGVNWYRAFFPLEQPITMDISPSYMNHPDAAERAAGLLSGARVVALLRDPADRAWSQYRLRRELGTEHRSFEEILEREIDDPPPAFCEYQVPAQIPYLGAGLYAEQLKPWFGFFGEDRVLIVDSAKMFANPSSALAEIQEFVGLVPHQLPYRRVNAAPAVTPPATLARVREFFEKPDAELRELTGKVFSWMTKT